MLLRTLIVGDWKTGILNLILLLCKYCGILLHLLSCITFFSGLLSQLLSFHCIFSHSPAIFLFFLGFYFWREGKRGRETLMCRRYVDQLLLVLLIVCPQLETWPDNPGMCPDWESNWWPLVYRLALNPLSHTSQGSSNSLLSFLHLVISLKSIVSLFLKLFFRHLSWTLICPLLI